MVLLTLKEVGKRLGFSPITIRLWITKNKINYYKIGESYRVTETEVDRILRESKREKVTV